MKKLLFSVAVLSMTYTAQAQCTPDGTLIPDAFGVYPDTTQNFVAGEVGTPYSQVLHFKAPTDAGAINPQFTGATINTFTVTEVNGIPDGLSYTCNISNCQYAGGSTGCASITGTPTTAGEYDITINITANISIPIIGQQNIPYSFEGYKIIILNEGEVSIQKQELNALSLFPNPATTTLTIANLNDFQGVSAIHVLSLDGKIVQSMNLSGEATLVLNTADLSAGVYMVELAHANGTVRQKFIKE